MQSRGGGGGFGYQKQGGMVKKGKIFKEVGTKRKFQSSGDKKFTR